MERERAKKSISNDLKAIGDKSGFMSLDLLWVIFITLPVETLVRFLCVSKASADIIRNRNFMKSYLMKSMTRPQSLIFTFKALCSRKRYFFSFSLPQTQNQSSSLATTYLMKCSSSRTIGPSVHGLICYGSRSEVKIYNPSTRRSITFPKIEPDQKIMYHFLGYDPIDGDHKVLGVTTKMDMNTKHYSVQKLWILTLGNENSWRLNEDFPPHHLDMDNESLDLCIDGVLYYKALLNISFAVISFDVQSEGFHLIEGPEKPLVGSSLKLTNYKRKLGVIFSGNTDNDINLWVLEDAVKHEWSKKFYVVLLPRICCMKGIHSFAPFCALDGVEIVLATNVMVLGKPYYVIIYDPRNNRVRQVCIEGFSEVHRDVICQTLSIFPGQVENLMFL